MGNTLISKIFGTYLIKSAVFASALFSLIILSSPICFASQQKQFEFAQSDASEEQSDDSSSSKETSEKPDSSSEKTNSGEEIENVNADLKAPEIQYDLSILPFPTRKMRQLIYEAASSGDIEKLRPYIGYGDDITMLSLGGFDEDPIDFLKSISGDSQGQELLAIITEILDSGFVLMDEGTDQEMYVWPYFYAHPLQTLTDEQKVQLFRLITFGDYQDMESFGAYIFYRLGISPEGRWRFFVAGD